MSEKYLWKCRDKKCMDRKARLPRIWSNTRLKAIAHLFEGQVINVSGWNDADKEGDFYRNYFVNAENYFISNFTGDRGASDAVSTDVFIDLTDKLPQKLMRQFSVVFNHTTLEHIANVDFAFKNLCDLSNDLVIVVVPFAQELHYTDSFGDYWRFTPMILRELFLSNEMEVIYESANDDVDAGIYLFFVGSRNPEKRESKMPEWKPIQSLGGWIGNMHPYEPKNIIQLIQKKMGL